MSEKKIKHKHITCFICNGEKFTYTGLRDLNKKLQWIKTMCFHCLGKGYIKVKDDNNG